MQRRVLVLTPYQYGTVPGPRSSIELWERILRPAGIEFEYAPFPTKGLVDVLYEPGHYLAKAAGMVDSYRRRLADLRRVSAFDAVLVYREAALVGPAWIERWVAKRRPVIYQLDDPLYVPYRSPFSGYLSYLKFFGKVASICRASRVVIVNSRQHREYASRYASTIYQIPSVIDADVYRPKPHPPHRGPVTVGWSGSSSTVKNLELIAGPLLEVAEESSIRLAFIGTETSPIEHLSCEAMPWRSDSEVADLSKLDIGLLPLPVNEWNKRKFYLKLIQYMALGIPCVATPLGAVPEVLEHGVTGLFAESPDEWRDCILRLAHDHDLRWRMGEAAAGVARREYTLQANAGTILAAFRAALE